MKFRKKPVVIEAMQLKWVNFNEIMQWSGAEFGHSNSAVTEGNPAGQCLFVCTLEGDMVARVGDYIIRGVQGEFYPCKPDIFEATYKKVN